MYHMRYALAIGYTAYMRRDTVRSAALLREARLRAGLNQETVAQRAGKTRPQIARWETGAVAPSLDTLLDVIRACGFDLALELTQPQSVAEDHLMPLQQLSPERRLDQMLERLCGAGVD
jgi:transcriptional regulator with XRE-family HTH domain